MKVLVLGATGGTGRAVVDELLARGHEVTAATRRPGAFAPRERLTEAVGDATVPTAVDAAVAGHDAVVVTLGIAENPLSVRLRGSRRTPLDVRSVGTRHVVAAMRRHGVRRLVVQSTYGQGETAGRLDLSWRLMFALVLRPQIRDTEVQERVVRDSGLSWVLVQPVSLTDGDDPVPAATSLEGVTTGMKVPRVAVARVLADAVTGSAWEHRTVSVSAGRPAAVGVGAEGAGAPRHGRGYGTSRSTSAFHAFLTCRHVSSVIDRRQ